LIAKPQKRAVPKPRDRQKQGAMYRGTRDRPLAKGRICPNNYQKIYNLQFTIYELAAETSALRLNNKLKYFQSKIIVNQIPIARDVILQSKIIVIPIAIGSKSKIVNQKSQIVSGISVFSTKIELLMISLLN
jgi:hypothetical protein